MQSEFGPFFKYWGDCLLERISFGKKGSSGWGVGFRHGWKTCSKRSETTLNLSRPKSVVRRTRAPERGLVRGIPSPERLARLIIRPSPTVRPIFAMSQPEPTRYILVPESRFERWTQELRAFRELVYWFKKTFQVGDQFLANDFKRCQSLFEYMVILTAQYAGHANPAISPAAECLLLRVTNNGSTTTPTGQPSTTPSSETTYNTSAGTPSSQTPTSAKRPRPETAECIWHDALSSNSNRQPHTTTAIPNPRPPTETSNLRKREREPEKETGEFVETQIKGNYMGLIAKTAPPTSTLTSCPPPLPLAPSSTSTPTSPTTTP